MLNALLLALSVPAGTAIDGLWINPAQSVAIRIAPCAERLCGTVVWATDKAKQDARKGTDALVGSALLTDLKPRGDGWAGKLFIPDLDRRANAKVRLAGPDELRVSGCAIGRTLCKSQRWTRIETLPAGS